MQALIITAYHNYEQLHNNCRIWSKYFDCYVHIDKKSNISDQKNLDELNKIENVHAYSKYKINWGSYLHLVAILDLLKEAMKNQQNKYFHLITGDDFPIKRPDEFEDFFKNNHINYMEYTDISDMPEVRLRFEIFHFMHIVNRKGKNKPAIFVDKVIRKIQTIAPFRRKHKFRYKGIVWGSYTRAAIEYVLQRFECSDDLKIFKFCETSEELVFQNYLMDSAFKDTISFDNLRFTVWDEPPYTGPRVLKMSDYEKMKDSTAFFARKITMGTELYQRVQQDYCK